MTTIRADAHKPEFHRAAPPQLPVRCATTANVTIATALNAGDTIDGVTLAAGDRVLVKDQSSGLQNGVYIAGAAPDRAFDMLEGVAAYGAVIYVVAGTANGGKTFRNTNTTVPTIDTDALTFSDYSPGAPAGADYLVGTAQGGLSAEIVVGTTPGGELGGTWASPTVDATHSGSAHSDFVAKADDLGVDIVIDGGGSAITTGVKVDIEMPFTGHIRANRLFADQSGSIVIDLWKDTYANFPPTVADTITASAKPTLSSAAKSQDSTLTGWTTAFSAGDIIRVNVDSATTVQRVTLSLTVDRS